MGQTSGSKFLLWPGFEPRSFTFQHPRTLPLNHRALLVRRLRVIIDCFPAIESSVGTLTASSTETSSTPSTARTLIGAVSPTLPIFAYNETTTAENQIGNSGNFISTLDIQVFHKTVIRL